jgi:hypothetical protein
MTRIIVAVLSCFVHRVSTVLTIAGVLGLTVLPTEHIHRTQSWNGQHTDIVHRHVGSHQLIGSETTVEHGDDERDIKWIALAITHPEPAKHVYPQSELLDEPLSVSSRQPACLGTIQSLRLSVHDPPWTASSGSRGPPTFLRT